MQNKGHDIDDLFRNKLEGFEINPPPAVWDRVTESIGDRRRKRKALFIWSMSSAAAIVLAFLMGWFLSDDKLSETEFYAQLEAIKNQAPQLQAFNTIVEQNINFKLERTQLKNINYSIPTIPKNTDNKPIFIKNLAFIQEETKANHVPQLNLVQKNEEPFFTESDRAILESNLLAINSIENPNSKSGWEIGVQASPVYRFDEGAKNSNTSLLKSALSTQATTSYQPNLSGGISLAYHANDKLSFIGGLNYSALTLAKNGVALSYAGHNWLNDRFSSDYGAESITKVDNNTNNNANNNLALNTQVGLANFELPVGASLASARASSVAPDMVQNYDFKQQAQYLELPLLMRYNLLDKRFGIHVLGGINTNVLVDNSAQLKLQNEVITDSKIDGLRAITFSSSFGMGLNFELTQQINLIIEPTFKMFLNSLNHQQYISAKPYTFGVFSGVSYHF